MGRNKKKKRDGDNRRPRLVLSFDEEKRREYLTGFHKRKVERKKAAIEEMKQRLKHEQRKLREERHQEYLKMLAEREEALEEADELDRLVTAKTESVQYDHPNHTVTVTTISDLDLSGARLLGLPPPEDFLSHSIVARTQSQKSQEETPTTGPGLYQEAPKRHSYQQDPAPPANWQSPAQRRVSQRTRPGPGLSCKDRSCLLLAVATA
ncbi:nucleolar protein 12 isoform X2 [Sturnira hondurensis]|uniref:nucleolar protein 12 isoform X2 n=1 Tax=Sturnira hondurensis TaxID=192404 RepID=UPI00187AFA3D|nr:nucleolar protein 12 isoform X2 [Sturnira hondurensis]